MSGSLVSASALILSRAAIVGPFNGPTLQVTEPGFDKASNLKLWSEDPRLMACFTELFEGLLFRVNNGNKQVSFEYANLQSNNIQRRTLVRMRPPGVGLFKKQLDLVAAYADLRFDRADEVIAQLNFPLPFWGSVISITEHRHKRTILLLTLAFLLAKDVGMRFKHIFACSRPVEFSAQIQPMTPTPGHSTLPSGHATEAFVVAALLEALLNAASSGNGTSSREQLQRLAARIAINRTVAGLHFPVDSAAGRLLGTALAEFIVARATGGKIRERGFDARKFEKPDGQALDFSINQSLDHGHGYSIASESYAVGKAPLVQWLWEEALKEWA